MGRSLASNSHNSRFAALNSRSGRQKFPFGRQRELAGKRLIRLAVFSAKTALFEHNRENSLFDGKNRELPPAVRCRNSPRKRPLKRFGGGSGEHVGLAVERGDQPVGALVFEDRGEFRA